MVYYSKRITKFTLNMTYGLLCFLQLVFTRFGMKKMKKFWQLFAVFSSWYQTLKTAFIRLVRSVQSLKLSQCVIISSKFSSGFKYGELTGQSRTFICFLLRHFLYFFWQHHIGPDFAQKCPYHLEMLFACKAPSEENILGVFQFKWDGITLHGIRNNEP